MSTPNKNDAFRLGCYAAAKHAGATHAEAIKFVADLDRQAVAQDAFRLGVFKTAKEHGANDEQAREFVAGIEKDAQWLGQALKGGTKLLSNLKPKTLGKSTAGFMGDVGKGFAGRGKVPAWMQSTQKWMKRNPGKTGVGVLGAGALGTYGAGKAVGSMVGGKDEAAAGQPGGQLNQRDLMLMMMLMQGNRGGNPYFNQGF